MANISREERTRREQERAQAETEAKRSAEFGGGAYVRLEQQFEDEQALTEYKPDWRPGTVVDLNTQEPAPDNRQFAGDTGRALNQMVGRAAIVENHDPQPHITRANNPPPVPNLHGLPAGEGDEVQLLRGYQPDEGQGEAQGIKRAKGEVLRVPTREARRLVNLGVAKFTETA